MIRYTTLMLHSVFSFIAEVIIFVITKAGYIGVGFLMAIDSCNIPIPSEIIMPFAGFLAQSGELSLWGVWGVIVAGTIGSIVGSWVSYELAGWIMKNRASSKFLKLLFSDRAVKVAQEWFTKYGAVSVLVGRVVPLLRTFISLPAGVVRMDMKTFLWFTAIGSLAWSAFMAYLGYFLGTQWQVVEVYFREIEYGILVVLLAWITWKMIWRKKKNELHS